MPSSTNKTLTAWVMLILLAIVWGTSFILVKKSLLAFPPEQVGAFRIFVAGMVFLPIVLSKIKQYPVDKTKWLVASGMTGYLLPAILFAYAGSKISSSLSGTLNATTPIFVLVVGAVFFGQKILSSQATGLLLGFVGSVILVLSGANGDLSFDNPYALVVVLATALYGFNANIVQKHLRGIQAILLSGYTLLFVGTFAGIMLCFTDFWERATNPENFHALLLTFILGAVNSGVAAVGYNYVLQMAGMMFASSVTYLIPIVALAVGVLDGEQVFLSQYIGMAIILVGVYLINRK